MDHQQSSTVYGDETMVTPKLKDIRKESAKESAYSEEGVSASINVEEAISVQEIAVDQSAGPSVVVVKERRRRFKAQEKLELVKLTYAPGNSVASVARQYDIAPSLLFKWRQLYKDGGLNAITPGAESSSAKEVAQLKDEIRRLHQLVGRQAADLELYKEALEVMREKKWIAR